MTIRIGILVPLLVMACVPGCDEPRGSRGGGSDAGGADAAAEPPAPRHSPGKAVIIAWAKALDAGDLAAVRAASVGNPEQIKALEALIARQVSETRLDAAIDAQFPQHELAGIKLQGLAATAEHADERAEGDTVTVWAYVDNNPLIARKQPDGEWKVALDHFTSDTEVTARTMAKAFDDLEAEVKAGTYASPERAMDAIETKVTEAAAEAGLALPTDLPDEVPADDVPDPDAPAAPSGGDGLD
jgi:hypothetical protein